MDLERLVAALEPVEVLGLGRPSLEVRDLAYDARAVTPGALFFAVPGERADGHDFAPEAVERGAVALVVERALDLTVPQVVVRDGRAAMAPAADAFYGEPTRELEVVGVTGTSGKTTTSASAPRSTASGAKSWPTARTQGTAKNSAQGVTARASKAR
jgi:UDP-N-acetylmuramoyl-L-alanyl-D-glutamate--2,6-diaminopimelate ligase